MTLKLYGSSRSTCNQRVAVVLAEKGVAFEQVTLNFIQGEHKQPAHLKRMPFGRMPVLEDDGFLLYESRAIGKYLAQKYAGQGTKLMPDVSDVKAYGLFETACSVEVSYFDPAASEIGFERVFKIAKGLGTTDEVVLAKLVKDLDETLAVYDTILADRAYLAGNEITLADLFHLPYGKMARGLGYQGLFDKYPNVTRWWDAMEARESWKSVIAS